MNKFIIGGSCIFVVVIAMWLLYIFYVPRMVARAIVKNAPPSYLPGAYKDQIKRLHTPVNLWGEKLIVEADSLGISLDDMLKAIDNVNTDEVIKVYDKIKDKKVTHSKKVFDLIRQDIAVEEIDLDLLEPAFLKHATPDRINRALSYIKQHQLIENIAPSTAKEVAKQLVREHYLKIDADVSDGRLVR